MYCDVLGRNPKSTLDLYMIYLNRDLHSGTKYFAMNAVIGDVLDLTPKSDYSILLVA